MEKSQAVELVKMGLDQIHDKGLKRIIGYSKRFCKSGSFCSADTGNL